MLQVQFTGKLGLWQASDKLRQKSSKIVSLGAPSFIFRTFKDEDKGPGIPIVLNGRAKVESGPGTRARRSVSVPKRRQARNPTSCR
jgi:hypothetical protein